MSQIMSQSAAFNAQAVAVNAQAGPTFNFAVGDHVALAGQQRFCDQCKMQGHTIQRCHKIHEYPPSHRLHNKGRRVVAAAA